MRTVLIAPLLAACMPGPSAETLVDELRVIAAVAEPPEVAPGEASAFEVVVADPLGGGAQVAAWMCTPVGVDVCAEADQPLAERLAVGTLQDGSFDGTLVVSQAAAPFVTDEPVPVPVWILACAPGRCPELDALVAAAEAGDASDAVETILATPTTWIADLPIDGVSLAAKELWVSTRPEGDRNHNPVLTVDGPLTSPAGAEVTLEVTVDDADDVAQVVGLSTGGGFGLPAFDVLAGQAVMRWFAPEEPGEVRLYTVATDGRGGTAVWLADATIE